MIKSGKYALYRGKEYKLNRDMKGNSIIITKDKDCIDDSFVDKYGGGVYTFRQYSNPRREALHKRERRIV